MKLSERKRNKQMNKEAIISLILYACFFIWWYATGYGLSGGDPKEYVRILGLPLWFFLSCIVGWILLCIAVMFTVKFLFVEIDLDTNPEDMPAQTNEAHGKQ